MTTTGLGLPEDCGCASGDEGKPCGCCEASSGLTPEDKTNAPALPSIQYRVGRYQTFRETMVRRIPTMPWLKGLTTRRDDDYAIALLDMWSYVGDVLTFYQERYANESFLRTATQRDSVLRLAALLDYRPSPGAAAVAWLAFTADKDKQVTVPAGAKVQSVPGQDEKPQKFETLESVVADVHLNQVRVFAKPAPHTALAEDSTRGVLHPTHAAGALARLKPGDRVVVVMDDDAGVEEKELTVVDDDALEPSIEWKPAVGDGGGDRMAKVAARFPAWGASLPQHYLKVGKSGEGSSTAYSFTKTAISYAQSNVTSLKLDGVFEKIPVGSRVLVVGTTVQESTILSVTQDVASGVLADAANGSGEVPPVGLSKTVTVLGLEDSVTATASSVVYLLDGADVRFANKAYPKGTLSGEDRLYVPLALLPDRPLGQAASASALQQPRAAPPQPRELLVPGRRVVLDDKSSQPILATIAVATRVNVTQASGKEHVELTLDEPLPRALDAESAYMHANVAKATHGETVKEEVLGDGDATRTFQRFTLSKSPVTFVPSPGSPGGVATTLEVDVNRIEWEEVDTLLLAEGTDEVHVSRLQADGTTVVEFGDGRQGSRLPTGRKNVTATYRVGLGKVGNVPAGSLRNALDKPVGLKGVTNPAAAEGGADAETMDVAREAAPGKVRTFGRIVSLRDFQDAALEYAGVTKAKATWDWQHGQRTVFLTVGGDPDAPLGPETLRSLAKDLDARRDATARVVLQPYKEIPVRVEAAIVVDKRYVEEDVVAAAQQALVDMLAYEAREFGEAVNLSDAYRTLQGVPGVVAARIDRFGYKRVADRKAHGVPRRRVNPRLPMRGTELAAFEDAATDAVVKGVPGLGEPIVEEDEE